MNIIYLYDYSFSRLKIKKTMLFRFYLYKSICKSKKKTSKTSLHMHIKKMLINLPETLFNTPIIRIRSKGVEHALVLFIWSYTGGCN